MTVAQPFPVLALLAAQVRRVDAARRERRLVGAAVLASLVVPGLGSAINGSARRGASFFAGFALFALLAVPVASIIGMFVFWLWGLTDALEGPTG